MASKSKHTKVGSLEVRISKNGTKYLVGTILGKDYVAFKSKAEFMKEHPTAPQVSGFIDREYAKDEKKDYELALWSKKSKNGKTTYLSGMVGVDEVTDIVAFYDEKHDIYNIYKQNHEEPKAKADTKNEQATLDITSEELPF